MPAHRTKKISTNSPLSQSPINPRLLRIREAAQYLSTTIWQLRTLTWSKQLPALKLGNRYVYDRTDLDAFIERQKVGACQ